MSAAVLLIDDDVDLCKVLKMALSKMSFTVETAHDAIAGLQKAYAIRPDVVVLDVMMPDMDGWQACERFREMTDIPIIFLTALGEQANVVKGLNLGADDYIVKPVTAQELGARVRAVLRRTTQTTPNGITAINKSTPILRFDNLLIDFDKYEVKIGDKRIDLSPTEFKLLAVLTRYKGRVLPHEFLLTEVWGPDYVGEIDYLRLYISYLRRKLEKDPAQQKLIYNEWGVGYRFGE